MFYVQLGRVTHLYDLFRDRTGRNRGARLRFVEVNLSELSLQFLDTKVTSVSEDDELVLAPIELCCERPGDARSEVSFADS